jgi:hypothetical protein
MSAQSSSQCRYHDFRQVLDNPEATVEVCRRCGCKEIYRKVGGRIDNKKYLKDHLRDFVQPDGPSAKIYEEIYGEAARKKSLDVRRMQEQKKASASASIEEGLESVRDSLRFWKAAAGKGFTDKEILSAIQRSQT